MRYFWGIVFLTSSVWTSANQLDSLKTFLLSTEGEEYYGALIQIGDYYNNKSPDSALFYFKKALPLVLDSPEQHTATLQKIGVQFDVKNDFDSAIFYLEKGIDIAAKHGLSSFQAKISNSLGVIAYRKGLYEKSIQYYLQGLEYAEKDADTSMIVKLNDNIGHIFYYQSEFERAKEHYSVALNYGSLDENPMYYANANMNLAYIGFATNNYASAKELLSKSIKVFEQEQDMYWLSNGYQNIAIACKNLGQYGEAESYYLKSLEIFENTGQKEGIAQTYVNLGEMFVEQSENDKAISYLNKGRAICEEIGVPEGVKYAYLGLKSAYENKGDYKMALHYFEKFNEVKDSLVNEQSLNQIHELETKYESEKKQREIESLNKQKALTKVQLEKQNQFIWAVCIVLTLAMGFLVQLFLSVRRKKKINKVLFEKNTLIEEVNEELNQQNEEIAAQRDEIETQKDFLELRNREIADSIYVAERIQKAFFKSEDDEKSQLPEHFVIFKPRDIVSGDFYWSHIAEDNGSKILYVSVVDCTGHGVPGAFMSMLGLSFINEILMHQPVIQPADLLNQLRKKVVEELGQSGESQVKEGMDMTVIRLNMNTLEMESAGAQNAVYYTDNGELKEIKGTKQSIGYEEHPIDFENSSIVIGKGEMIYLCSDGYADQFGGVDNKKIGYRKLRELLGVQSRYDVKDQKQHLESFITSWMEYEDQIDDITLLGMRIA